MNAYKLTSFARLALAFLFCVIASTGFAATFEVKRSISMDQWITWPGPDTWFSQASADNFPEWQKFTSDQDLRELKTLGLTSVRLPIDPAVLLHSHDADYQSRVMQGVHRAIERLRNAGLDVIVDMHTIPYGEDTSAIGVVKILDDDFTFVRYLTLLQKMASELKKYSPENVALEVINEPLYGCGRRDILKLWHAQLQQLHSAARAGNPDITLVLPGACYSSADGLAKIDPRTIKDKNVLWTFHSYEPFILTHQGANWVGEPVSEFQNLPYPPELLDPTTVKEMPERNAPYISKKLSGKVRSDAGWYIRNEFEKMGTTRRLENFLAKPFKTVTQWADKYNIDHRDIFLGEFGFIATEYGKSIGSDPAWRLAYIKDMIALAEKNGFGWSLWSYGGAFGMVQEFGGAKRPVNMIKLLDLK